jgi:hypothetical protein
VDIATIQIDDFPEGVVESYDFCSLGLADSDQLTWGKKNDLFQLACYVWQLGAGGFENICLDPEDDRVGVVFAGLIAAMTRHQESTGNFSFHGQSYKLMRNNTQGDAEYRITLAQEGQSHSFFLRREI